MCKVSIIVPVYNTEQYLPRCLDSILSQSFTDFELLLVDDGSKDNSGAICDAYAEKDSRVRVFHKEKGGVSSARNLGLDEAKGEWICFADSDDWLNEKYLEHLMDSDSNLVVSGLQSFGNASWSLCPQKRSIFPVNDICSHWNDELKGYFDYPVAKRFKSSIVHTKGIRFNKDLFYSEDLCFVLSYMVNIDSVDEIDVVDYQYFTPPPPTTTTCGSGSRDYKFRMSAKSLKEHYEYHDKCLTALERRVSCKSADLFIREDVSRRLMNKFVSYLHSCKNIGVFYDNVRFFRRQPWAKYMLGLLKGKKGRRIAYGAYYCPFLSYYLEKAAKWYRKIQMKV